MSKPSLVLPQQQVVSYSQIPAHYVVVERCDLETGESREVFRQLVHSAQRQWWVNRFNMLAKEKNLPFTAQIAEGAAASGSPDEVLQGLIY